jgi:hypothetical protein
MAWMSDEAYDYYEDCKDKKFTARSARNRRGHTGSRGGMKTAADYMTKKELRAMNSEVVTYRMGAPMNWYAFSTMPDDLKKMYVKNLRKNFNVPDDVLAMAMGVDFQKFADCLKSIKLSPRISEDRSWYDTDDCGRFQTWWIVVEEVK